MREIRARISQRHGIDLTTQQIQELAARRLEAILDPRTVKPSLLEQLRRSAGAPVDTRPADPALSYSFEATTLYESPSGFVRFMRRLLQPLLKLFFNPNPLIQAMHTQAQINQAALAREAERDRRQAEWNALHYEILQRLVTEISRTSLETQGLSMRVEALAAKVDFNERRVRGVENTLHQARPTARTDSAPAPQQQTTPVQPRESAPSDTPSADGSVREGSSEGGRRRRRRRRGRRPPTGPPLEGQPPQVVGDASAGAAGADVDLDADLDEEDDESVSLEVTSESASPSAPEVPEPAYVIDRFVSSPASEVSTPATETSREASPPAPEPVAPAATDLASPPEPHEPSDSGSGT